MGRNELRGKLMASKRARRSERVVVDINGENVEFEVRAPSLREENKIKKAGTMVVPDKSQADGFRIDFDALAQKIQATILLVYVPGTDERVYEPADAEEIARSESGSWHDVLGEAAVRLMNAPARQAEAIEKNSESALTDSSSSR